MKTKDYILTRPETLPNPQIKCLMGVKDELYEMAMRTDNMDLRGEYMAAYNRVLFAIEHVYKAKNILAGEG